MTIFRSIVSGSAALAVLLSACSDGSHAPSRSVDAGHTQEEGGVVSDAESPALVDAEPLALDAESADAAPLELDDAGAPSDAYVGPDGDAEVPIEVPLSELVERGQALIAHTARPAYGALAVASHGDRSYVVESRRDAEPGPLGIPWRSRFRVAAYAAGQELWAFAADPDDVISDVVAHPSGDLSVVVERYQPARDAYELVRLSAQGEVRERATLAAPATIPSSDYAPDDPQPLVRRKGPFSDATAAGWVRLVATGEDLALAIMSYLDAPANDPRTLRRALVLERVDWTTQGYIERWTRVVEGAHVADPAAWAYDELRWREQAVRPFLARDALNGELSVGRAWNQSRCEANRATFMEFAVEECRVGAVNAVENERLPLAVTRFSSQGTRLGTSILRPDPDAAEQVPFALAVRGGELAVAGSLVRRLGADGKRTYPDVNGYVDYDGYIAIYDAAGALLRQHDFNLGRGDVLAALRWTERGLVAVGSSDWDRWQGGMSISRGAKPVIVWLSSDATRWSQRLISIGSGERHWNLHDVAVRDRELVGYGFSDAPMTHSADGVGSVARTFGPLQVRLTL